MAQRDGARGAGGERYAAGRALAPLSSAIRSLLADAPAVCDALSTQLRRSTEPFGSHNAPGRQRPCAAGVPGGERAGNPDGAGGCEAAEATAHQPAELTGIFLPVVGLAPNPGAT
jgi:hypothetical protein